MPQHDGFHDLLTTALPRLRTHARALTRNRAAADDLVQDAVANALVGRDSFTQAPTSAPGSTASSTTASSVTPASGTRLRTWTTCRTQCSASVGRRRTD